MPSENLLGPEAVASEAEDHPIFDCLGDDPDEAEHRAAAEEDTRRLLEAQAKSERQEAAGLAPAAQKDKPSKPKPSEAKPTPDAAGQASAPPKDKPSKPKPKPSKPKPAPRKGAAVASWDDQAHQRLVDFREGFDTDQECAEALGVGPGSLRRWLDGQSVPQLRSQQLISEVIEEASLDALAQGRLTEALGLLARSLLEKDWTKTKAAYDLLRVDLRI